MAAFANSGRRSVRDHRFTDRRNLYVVQTVVAAATTAGAVQCPGSLVAGRRPDSVFSPRGSAPSARLASRTFAFDISTLRWSDRILQAAGLDRSKFAEVRPSGT